VRHFALTLILLSPLVSADTCQNSIDALRWLESADVSLDAKQALAAGNMTLKGVRGISVYVPGVEQKEGLRLLESGNVDVIEGTGDVVCAGINEKLDNMAIDYATQYNKIILAAQQAS